MASYYSHLAPRFEFISQNQHTHDTIPIRFLVEQEENEYDDSKN